MSAEIIQFIRGPKHHRGPSDFPTIAFRSGGGPRRQAKDNYDGAPGEKLNAAPGETNAMPRSLTEIRSLARSHTRSALNVLVAVMRNTKATPPARVAAANAILDRGWGKATQPIENGDDGALELIHRIERVIVHPENPDSQNL